MTFESMLDEEEEDVLLGACCECSRRSFSRLQSSKSRRLLATFSLGCTLVTRVALLGMVDERFEGMCFS